jgi:hypothetical protein
VVEDGHGVNCEPAHVFGDCERHVTEVVHIVENSCVLQLLMGPLNICWVS